MKFFKFLLFSFLMTAFLGSVKAQEIPQPVKNDTITLAQAYMNLYLTETYFDSLSKNRISKILSFEKDELGKIEDSTFLKKNKTLYYFTKALYYQNQSKLFSQTRMEFNRNILRRFKSIFDNAIHSYNSAAIDEYQIFEKEKNDLYEMINFDSESNSRLRNGIYNLKNQFNTLFNEDIFPDFQRIFKRSITPSKSDIDSLSYFTGIYDMPLSMNILSNSHTFLAFSLENSGFINPEYTADARLDLISRYLQLKYLASRRARVTRNFNKTILYEAYYDFISLLENEDDPFITKELNAKVCATLLQELKQKFPPDKNMDEMGQTSAPIAMIQLPPTTYQRYFFPNPAPLASADSSLSNFKPALTTLNQIDGFLSAGLIDAGFKNQLHYYYSIDGFALTTSLEKFNIDGSKVSADKRFSENLGGDGKFSYYEVFKSMFFSVKSEYRMFAFIIASKSATMSNDAMSTGFAEQLLKNSYDTLPADLKNKILPNKTLSVFVYHFHQNNIGEVPELDLSRKLTVQDHLKNAGLIQIIQ